MPIMQPNDMPLIGLPLGMSDEAATELVDFLYALVQALEQHYCGQLLRYARRNEPGPEPFQDHPNAQSATDLGDTPF